MSAALGPDPNTPLWSVSPPVDDLTPVIPSVLLQRVALDRANPLRPHCETTRAAVFYARAFWAHCSSLTKLSVQDFRAHVLSGLVSLPLDETTRHRLCEQLLPLLDASLFWRAVEQADLLLQAVEARPCEHEALRESIWGGQFFRDRFADQPCADVWARSARDVVGWLGGVRTFAHGRIGQKSNFLHTIWQSGNFLALPVAIQERLPAAWIVDAVAAIERAASTEAPTDSRRHARSQIRQINAAKAAVGRGDTPHLSPAAALAAKRLAASRARAVTRLILHYERKRGEGLTHKEAFDFVKRLFLNRERITDENEKKEILKRLKVRLSKGQEFRTYLY